MKRLIIIVGILVSAYTITKAQDMTQTIRGTIIDQDTQMALIGATVRVADANPIIGTVADMEGNFRLEKIPVGRVTLIVSFIGYEDKVLPNLLIGSAKELVLRIPLIESVDKLDEVIVTAKKNKAEVLNEMSLVSSRSFSVDETKRYAGSFGDPARMVSAFAGVTSQPEGNNDIIVRGNSPKGILWKLEGVEIPNPNHFANEGATGGPINALNSNMLSDSDFMSGAFAPEYGNALSGVFDMKLRTGNNEKQEYTATASTLGLDFTAEGPFSKGYNGSYVANFRYSSLDLLDKAGLVDFGGVPRYQDATFKVNLPINQKNFISIFGLGGISNIAGDDTSEDEKVIYGRSIFGADMGVTAITHNYLINDKSYLKTILSVGGTRLKANYDLPNESQNFYNVFNSDFTKSYVRAASTYSYKFNAIHKVETGVIYTKLNFNMIDNSWNFERDQLETVLNDNGHSYTTQAFASWKYRVTEDLTFTSGLHWMQLGLNNSQSVEPRMAMKWKLNPNQSFSAGFGLHSRVESMAVYLSKQQQEDGSLITLNRNLGLSKAAHYVVGYDQFFGANHHFKLEVYYQQLFNVAIENDINSTYSLLNVSDSYINRSLVNKGTGRNYGLELTFERYLNHGFYYMTSASLYKTLYTNLDGIERQTAFSGNYVFNVLGGKEWKLGKSEKNRVLFLNSKFTVLGGKRYTPINLEASRQLGDAVRYDDRPYSAKADDVLILNLAVGTRRNKKNTTREFKIDVQNVTNNQAVINEYYVQASGEILKSYQLALLPTISYTISF